MRLLELFSGTGSVGNVWKRENKMNEVTSLDIHPQYNPTKCVDILKWNYREYVPGTFHFIWASPPCTEYSFAKTKGIRDLALADAIVKRTIKIIAYLKPKYWVIENPRGLLRQRDFMKKMQKYRKECTYCKYGTPYKKATDIWTNVNVELKTCNKHNPCQMYKRYKGHPQHAQRYSKVRYANSEIGKGTHKELLYTIPNKLSRDIFKSMM